MTVSKPKASGKTRNPSVAATRSGPAPDKQPIKAQDEGAPKRVVMTSSEIEAAAKNPNAAKPAETRVEKSTTPPSKSSAQSEGATAEKAAEPATPKSALSVTSDKPVEQKTVTTGAGKSNDLPTERSMARASSSPASKQSKPAPKAASKNSATAMPGGSKDQLSAQSSAKPVAKPDPAQSTVAKKTAEPKAVDPKTSPKAEKVSIVTQKTKSAASAKPVAAKTTAAKKTTSPASPAKPTVVASEAAKTKAAPAPNAAAKPTSMPAKAKTTEPTAASPAKSAKSVAKTPTSGATNDMFGMGAMFMDASKMEQFFDLWKAPEVDAIFTASNDALEDSVSVANDAFSKMFETMTGQADVFSGAGSRVVAQYEELVDTQQKKMEEVWQASSNLMEKSGGMGVELVAWAQREMDASQADLEALSKVESLSDFQDVHARILNRCVESGVAESEKMQEMMFSAISESLSAMTKATNAVMK